MSDIVDVAGVVVELGSSCRIDDCRCFQSGVT